MLHINRLWLVFLCLCGLCKGMTVQAEEADYQNFIIDSEGFSKEQNLSDGNRTTYTSCKENGIVTVSREDGIAGIYVEFDRVPAEWFLTNPATGENVECGIYSFLHEYVDVVEVLGECPKSLTIEFEAGTVIADIYVLGEGELPAMVQTWVPPCEQADLLLLTSHSDDEQLFFSGVLPYYAGERKLDVQVVYVVQHFEANGVQNHQRPHELLDGLWTVGVKYYPIMSDFPDLYAESKNRDTAFSQATKVYESVGIAYTDFLSYIIECLRRCKPLVVVSHDLDGEYGHGTHVVCAKAITEAIALAADETQFPDSYGRYGGWSVEKLYLHLHEENTIVMDWDVPLDSFGGKTAFEVSQDGFACHKSQHWTWFYKWMYGTEERPVKKATDIRSYSPCNYGLYYTTVGNDVVGGDFFENVVSYEERRLIAEKKAEEERLAQLEAERLAKEAEDKAAEEARLKAEEEARIKQEEAMKAAQLAEEKALEEQRSRELVQKEERRRSIAIFGAAGAILLVAMILISRKKKKGAGNE